MINKKCFNAKVMAVATLAVLCVGCASTKSQKPKLANISRTRVLVDSRYDVQPDAEATAFLKPYSAKVDSLMSPVVGQTARYMASKRPESELSNLLPDILIWASKRFNEKPDFAVYNVGGIRAAFAKGNITVGDVLDVAPFENKICFLTLSGDKVRELFTQIAARYGEGVSHAVKLEIGKDSTLVSATVNGEPIDVKKSYRIATLDYLAQGNDQMVAFKAKTDVVSPLNEENNVRFLIMDYFRAFAAKGQAVDSKVEGRIVVK